MPQNVYTHPPFYSWEKFCVYTRQPTQSGQKEITHLVNVHFALSLLHVNKVIYRTTDLWKCESFVINKKIIQIHSEILIGKSKLCIHSDKEFGSSLLSKFWRW